VRQLRSLTIPLALAVCACLDGSSRANEDDVFTLPPPTGPSAVGTTRWTIADGSRPDPFEHRGPRQVEVIAWYPAAGGASAPRAPYLWGGLASARSFATVLGQTDLLDDLARVQTHASLDAPPENTSARLPLLIFSHGYTGIPGASASLLEDLASHGYAVLSVVHPYEATAATLGDGRVVTTLDPSGDFREAIKEIFVEWKNEDAEMSAVTKADDEAERIRILRRYLGGLTRTHEALRRWVDDVCAVVNHLSDLPRGSTAQQLAARLDVSRFGVFGHSMGGVTSAEFCLAEKRCAAVLNLDGIPQYGSTIDTPLKRPLLMVYSARPGRLGASDPIYKRSASPYYRVDVAGTLHVDFTDMTFWAPLRARHITGPLPAEQANDATRTIVRAFFDQELRGRPSALLSGRRALPGVTVSRP
jgi:dienelactone hydrolase